ncbi:MAG: hypothetical protein ACM33T_06275 [Solirubrobacterales bacterium]
MRIACDCMPLIDQSEAAFRAGASFTQCVDNLSDALRCSGVGCCDKRLLVSERAASLVISLLKRG